MNSVCKIHGISQMGMDSTGPIHLEIHIHTRTCPTLTEKSSQTNVILQYKLLASILSAACSVIQQS